MAAVMLSLCMQNQLALRSLVLRGRVAAAFVCTGGVYRLDTGATVRDGLRYAGVALVVKCFAPFFRLQLGAVALGQLLSWCPSWRATRDPGPRTSSSLCAEGQLDTSVVGVADRHKAHAQLASQLKPDRTALAVAGGWAVPSLLLRSSSCRSPSCQTELLKLPGINLPLGVASDDEPGAAQQGAPPVDSEPGPSVFDQEPQAVRSMWYLHSVRLVAHNCLVSQGLCQWLPRGRNPLALLRQGHSNAFIR
jgi:hypothetical protein